MSISLGGASFVYNGIKQDYHYKETIACLSELCDKVVIVDAGSDDGTREDLSNYIDCLNKESSHTKVYLISFKNEDWHAKSGREKLSYFSNKAIEALDTDYVFYLQCDEILHEDSFQYVRHAIETGYEAFFVQRLNLWRDPGHMLNVSQDRKPCSTEVIRLAKTKYRCIDDAESLGVSECYVLGDIGLMQIYHMGFIREKVKHLVKIRHMLTEVFGWSNDTRAENCDEFIPERFFSDQDIIPIPRPLPKFIQKWAEDRYPSIQ